MTVLEYATKWYFVQNLEGKVKEIEKDIAVEKGKNKELTEANQTHEKRNAMMDSDLKTFKEQHLTAKNKVTRLLLSRNNPFKHYPLYLIFINFCISI